MSNLCSTITNVKNQTFQNAAINLTKPWALVKQSSNINSKCVWHKTMVKYGGGDVMLWACFFKKSRYTLGRSEKYYNGLAQCQLYSMHFC